MQVYRCLKIEKDGQVVGIHRFNFAHERVTWLLLNGFFECDGVWLHLDARIAGMYDDVEGNNGSILTLADRCTKKVKRTKSMWDGILRVGTNGKTNNVSA